MGFLLFLEMRCWEHVWSNHSTLCFLSFCQIFWDNKLDVHIRIWDYLKSQANTRYLTSKFFKIPHAENLSNVLLYAISCNLLNVLLNVISCMNWKKMIILFAVGNEKQKSKK